MKISYSKFFCPLFFLAAVFLFLFHNAIAQEVKYKEKSLEVTKQKTNGIDETNLRQKMRADGLSDPVIDKLIAQRKIWEKQGRNVNWSSAKNSQTPVVNASCNGLGVEGGWGAWNWQNGSNSGSNPPTWAGAPAANPGAPFYAITTGAGVDPNTPSAGNPSIPVVCPGFGNNSIKIGDDCGVGSNCNQLTYPLNVTAQDTNFVFAYAIVVEDAGHLPSEQPFCEIAIYDSNGHTIPCVPLIYTGGPNIPGFYPVSGGGCANAGADQYKPWTLVGVNLSPYLGQNLNVVITNCDCIYGGHFCYSYWDFLCGTASLSGGCVGNQSTICGPIDPQIAYTYQWYNNGIPIAPPQGTQQCINITAQPGDTITVAVNQPSGCDFHLLYVPASVQPNFTSTGLCGNYTFSDSSTASPGNVTITSWNWSFPGGTPATSTTPTTTVTYNAPGTYSVTMIVTCSAGCTDTIIKMVTVNALPTATFTSTPPCLGAAVILTDGSVSPAGDPITAWNWAMTGGAPATSTSQNTSTTYPASGNYSVTLVVTTQQGCTSTIIQPVTVNPVPVSILSGNDVCFNNLSTFTDLSIGNNTISNWDWDFGVIPVATSTLQNPSYTYGSAGTYTVTLIVTNNFGCKDTNTTTVVVNPLPAANFTSVPVCLGDPTCFSDLSTITTGTVTGWSWNFGDANSGPNNISLLQNPCHVFTGIGPWTVLLTATSNSGCQSNITLPATINPPPVAAITPQNVCIHFPAPFSDASTVQPGDPLATWDWNFGDGSPHSGLTNPNHNYAAPGTYTVTLIITSTKGCKDTTTNTVTIYNNPVAAFSSPDSGCSPVCQTFHDLSTSQNGNITNWAWNFPGGSPSVGVNSTSTSCWNNPGSYNVQLIITTQYGCKDTLLKTNYINVYAWPHADFCIAPDQASVNAPVFNFCDQWTSDVTQWMWNFGDTTTDNTSTNPVHSYSATSTNNDYYLYNVCLYVQNQHGCRDSICKPVELVPEFEFFIPNCFTPNGDDVNAFFYGKGRGIKDYNIWLFDRWGNMIWDCHREDKNTNWDSDHTSPRQEGLSSFCKWNGIVEGGASGAIVQEDVYVWKVKLTDIFDKVHTYIGHVSVVQ